MLRNLFFVIALFLSLLSEGQNLITNGSFENGTFGSGHGDYYLPGWHGFYYAYNWVSTSTGESSDGTHKIDFGTGSFIETDDASLISVSGGSLYKLSFDLQTYSNSKPELYVGTYGYIIFYDANNQAIKTEFTQSLQDDGVYPWQTFDLFAVAPETAVKARVKIDASQGTYPNIDFRSVYVDNIVFTYIPEDEDRLMVRNAPKMIEPGKTYQQVIRYAAKTDEQLSVKLMQGGNSFGEINIAVNKGRGLIETNFTVPEDAPSNNDYSWVVSLPEKTVNVTGVFIDPNQIGSGTIDADNSNIVYTGRNNFSNPKAPILYWFGSEIQTCFSGTSLAIKSTTAPNGFGGYVDLKLNYVIDNDFTNVKEVLINGANVKTILATGLSNGTHTVRIMKADESTTGTFTFHGFVLDTGKGLLKPDNAGNKRIEFFGNSVTSGGNADFNFNGYAPLLARTLQFEPHIISKGGSGVASSWGGMVTLLDFYDKLDFLNPFDVSNCTEWDFNQWQPDVIFIGVGHNDQFNDGWKTFTERYRTLIYQLETKYPEAHIFCSVPLISNPYSMLATALNPILSEHPRVHFRSQLFTDASVYDHPSTAGHQAMVYGDATRWSTAEWIEETMGWGIGLPKAAITNKFPSCRLTSPDNNATFNIPATISLSASALDTDGTISKVEFFQGGEKLGESLSSPFSFIWEDVNAGTYNLTARATDNEGAIGISLPVKISVSEPGMLINPSFEINSPTQTPLGWNESFTSLNSYTEAGTGSHDGTYHLTHYSGSPFEASTYQIVNGLTNGTYLLNAWFVSGGGQPTCELAVRDFGGIDLIAPIPKASNWTKVEISGIKITNGQCKIEFYTKGNAGNWSCMDDVELTLIEPSTGIGVFHEAEVGFTVSPNPISTDITIFTKGFLNPEISIYNLEGQKLFQRKLFAERTQISTLELHKGIYIISVKDCKNEQRSLIVK